MVIDVLMLPLPAEHDAAAGETTRVVIAEDAIPPVSLVCVL